MEGKTQITVFRVKHSNNASLKLASFKETPKKRPQRVQFLFVGNSYNSPVSSV